MNSSEVVAGLSRIKVANITHWKTSEAVTITRGVDPELNTVVVSEFASKPDVAYIEILSGGHIKLCGWYPKL